MYHQLSGGPTDKVLALWVAVTACFQPALLGGLGCAHRQAPALWVAVVACAAGGREQARSGEQGGGFWRVCDTDRHTPRVWPGAQE